jgi:exopolysaccharide transport family protein
MQDYNNSDLDPANPILNQVFVPKTIDLRRQIALLRRRLKFCVLAAVVVFFGVAVYTSYQPRIYTATSQVMLDRRQQQVTDTKEVLSGLPPETGIVESEVEILKSRTLAGKVASALNLDRDPEFNPAPSPPSFFQTIVSSLPWPSSRANHSIGTNKEIAISELNARIVDRVLSRLKIARVGVTYAINISFQSVSPSKAAMIANAFTDKYLLEQLDAKYDATRRASEWLSSRLAGLKAQAEASDMAAREFEISNGLVGAQTTAGAGETLAGATLQQQQISELSAQVATAHAQLAEAEANLATANKQLAMGSTGGDVGAALLSPVIQALRRQRSEMSAKIADLSGKMGPKNPIMINAERELADTDAQIQIEIQRLISNLQAQVEAVRQRSASLDESLAKAKGLLNTSNAAAGHLAVLQSRAQADASVYQSFLDRFKQTTAQEGIGQSDARVVSYAEVPSAPTSPKVVLNLALGLVLGFGAAAGLVILMDALEHGLYTSDDVERFLNVPSIGSIPQLTTTFDYEKLGSIANPPLDAIIQNPLSSYAEAYRNLRTAIMTTRTNIDSQVIIITSALPEEGKTTTSICLARTFAIGGSKTILVDCDLRKNSVLRTMGKKSKVGLLQVLSEKCKLEDALMEDEASGAFVLPLIVQEYVPQNIFASAAMDRLLDRLRTQFEVVLLDTAPVLPIADTRVLAPKSDAVVFLAQWRKTPRKAVENGLRQLQTTGATISGVVLTQVNAKEQARSGYGDDGYYYKSYRSYYGYNATS